MKHIDFEFNGKTYALSFTAEALFTIYDKFGYTADILGTTHVLEPTLELSLIQIYSFHTQRRKFQKKPVAKKIPGAYVGGTRLHCTAMGRGDIIRR